MTRVIFYNRLGGFAAACGLSVCMCACHIAKAIGWSEMPFGRDTRVVPSNIVLDRGPDHPTRRGDFGVGTPTCIANTNRPVERGDAVQCQIIFGPSYMILRLAPVMSTSEKYQTDTLNCGPITLTLITLIQSASKQVVALSHHTLTT